MSIPQDSSGSGIPRTLARRALLQVIPEEHAAGVWARTLVLAGDRGSADLEHFLTGPLREALAEEFGARLAVLGVGQVMALLGLGVLEETVEALGDGGSGADDAVTRRHSTVAEIGSAADADRAVLAGEGAATRPISKLTSRSLVIVTRDPNLLLGLAPWISAGVTVSSHLALPAPTGGTPDHPFDDEAVVLDCREASAAELGARAGHVLSEGLVILWGPADGFGSAEVNTVQCPNWICCGPDAGPAELGMLLSTFADIGSP